MTGPISTVAELEACVGVAGLPVRMKIIDHLDAQAAGWIAASPLAFVGVGGPNGPRVAAAGGPAGFAGVLDDRTLRLPRAMVDDLGPVDAGQGAGVLFLAPGVGETLRANGRIAAVSQTAIDLAIEECFVHCAKALIRSDFWAAPRRAAPGSVEDLLGETRFLALATMDAGGRIDISPKGDPAGLLIRYAGGRAVLAERPGNRLAFGYRNMIEEPRVAALCLVPGADAVAILTGRAQLTDDETVRQGFVVEGKTPILATEIAVADARLSPSPALTRAQVWTGAAPPPALDAAAVLVAHVKLNKAQGVQATALRLAVNRGLVAKGLESNYRTDLY